MQVAPAAGDAHKLEIAQFPQGSLSINVPSQFLVRRNGAKGELDAKVNNFHIFNRIRFSVCSMIV